MKRFASAALVTGSVCVLAAAGANAFAQSAATSATAAPAPVSAGATATQATATPDAAKAVGARKSAGAPAAKAKSKFVRMSLGLSARLPFVAPVIVPPAPAFALEGSYALSGAGEDGVKYVGTATLTKGNGEMYRGNWRVGKHVYAGPCFRDGDTLSCGWSARGSSANVMAYEVGANDQLDGVWFGGSDTKLGQEILPTGVTSLLNVGMYTQVSGTNSDGSAYSGVAVVWPAFGVAHPTYRFDWAINNYAIEGLALTSSDPIVVGTIIGVGFADGTSDYGVLMYRIDTANDELVGHWAQSIGNVYSGGQEVATKRAATVTVTSLSAPASNGGNGSDAGVDAGAGP